ncbi:MAG: hypothetical protein ACRD5K_01325 [Candidatus Acidiferrales bacterium]
MHFIAVVCALALVVPSAGAQQSQSGEAQNNQNQAAEPIPAYHSPFVTPSDDQEGNSQSLQSDTRPLSGAQYISTGNLTTNRSYWQPHLDFSGTADSNPQEGTSSSGWGAWGSFLAGVDIHHTAGTSEMLLSYTGGAMYSDEASVPDGTVQKLGFAEKISLRRSVLSFLDQLSYLPQASLGLGGVGGLPSTGGSEDLGPGFVTDQSILSGQGQNLENSSVVQLEAFLTPRSSVTISGGYSLLHFFDSNLVDSGNITARGGYNYQLTQHNTMALQYSFNQFSYTNFNQSIDTHGIQGSFGRRVTGRLALQFAAGPELALFSGATASTGGTGGTTGASNPSSAHVYWSLNSAMKYQYQRTSLGLTYLHGVAEGSGVFLGSLNDTVTGTMTRRMSRTFSSGLSAGYARNSALQSAGGQLSGQNYDYWFAGASLARPFSETLALTLSYQFQYQTSNSTFCIGGTCGTSVIRHLITVGFSWHQRPLLF